MKQILAIYCLVIGAAVLVMWSLILAGGNLPEGKIALGFHLYSEFAMAVICLTGGVMLLLNRRFSRETCLAGLAMVVYSTLNAAGYYGQKGEYAAMGMFVVLFVLTVMVITGQYLERIRRGE